MGARGFTVKIPPCLLLSSLPPSLSAPQTPLPSQPQVISLRGSPPKPACTHPPLAQDKASPREQPRPAAFDMIGAQAFPSLPPAPPHPPARLRPQPPGLLRAHLPGCPLQQPGLAGPSWPGAGAEPKRHGAQICPSQVRSASLYCGKHVTRPWAWQGNQETGVRASASLRPGHVVPSLENRVKSVGSGFLMGPECGSESERG